MSIVNGMLVLYTHRVLDNSQDGDTPLHRACYYGNLEVVSLLLSEGADPNIENNVHSLIPLLAIEYLI
jgi:ankyrin repeat protein